MSRLFGIDLCSTTFHRANWSLLDSHSIFTFFFSLCPWWPTFFSYSQVSIIDISFFFIALDNPYIFLAVCSFWTLDQIFFMLVTFKDPGFVEKAEGGSLFKRGLLRMESTLDTDQSQSNKIECGYVRASKIENAKSDKKKNSIRKGKTWNFKIL